MSFVGKMLEAKKQMERPPSDPWRKPLENALKGVEAMSTVALLDLVGAPHTTQSARRLAATMRDLNFVPIQSRRLMPGGFRDTVSRGWARPLRPLHESQKVKPQQGAPAPGSNLSTTGDEDAV